MVHNFNNSKRGKDMYRQQWEQSNTELSRKNKELIIKIEEIDLLREKYEDLVARATHITQMKVSLLLVNLNVK